MPENRGNAVAYAGGRTHRPLPSATDKTYRSTHEPQPPKATSTFDWDWNKATCTSCQTKVAKDTLDDGVCSTCRGLPAVVTSPLPRQAYSPYEEHELDTVYQPPRELPDVSDLPAPAPRPVEDPTVEPEPEAEPEPAARVARQLRAPTQPPTQGVDLLEECIQHAARTFRAAHGIQDPLVGILRTAALSAIAALDFYVALHCTNPTTDPRGTARPPTDGAASTTNPATTPRLGRGQPAADPRGEARQRPAPVRRPAAVRRPAVDVDETAVLLEYAAGDSAPVIGRRHGVLPKRIRQILLAHHVQLRDDRAGNSGRRRVEDDHDLNERVRTLYVDQRLTTLDVAQQLQIGRKRVTRILEVLDVPLRPAAHLAHPELSEADAASAVALYLGGKSLVDIGAEYGVRAATIRDLVTTAGHPIRAKGASHAIAERMRGLGVTAAQIKDWAVATGVVEARPAGLVGRGLIDAYVAAHQQEGPAA